MERSSRVLVAALGALAVRDLLAMLVVMLPFALLAALMEWQRQIQILHSRDDFHQHPFQQQTSAFRMSQLGQKET
jgi:hypothetical protein